MIDEPDFLPRAVVGGPLFFFSALDTSGFLLKVDEVGF